MNLWMLSFASFFNDVASEATLRLIPLFLSQVLGVSMPIIGLIEGIATATATLIRPISGWVSDHMSRRKPLVVAGYALSGLTKPFLLFANHWTLVLLVRFSDRVGKGVRSAPRDSMIADEAHERARGKSFGLNQMLDTLGAILGVSIAAYVLSDSPVLTRSGFHTVVLVALVPAFLAVAVVAFGVKENTRARPVAAESLVTSSERITGKWFHFRSLKKLPKTFWRYIAIVVLFTLSNSSDAFIILKASNTLHASVVQILLCLVLMNIASTLIAMPAGKFSDSVGRRKVIASGWIVYAVSYVGFGLVDSMGLYFVVFALYGAFYGLTEATEKAFVADLVGAHQGRGLAYGVFAGAVGLMSIPASLGFGFLMQTLGSTYSFLIAAALAAFSALALIFLVSESKN